MENRVIQHGLSKALLRYVAFLALGSGLRINNRLRQVKGNNYLTILNLHRIAEYDYSSYVPLNPKVFEDLLSFVKCNFRLTTFGSLDQVCEGNKSKPPMILSFDDGYKDFIDVAVPILDKHRIKVNQNIIPNCIQTGLPPLNVLLQDFIGKASESEIRSIVIPNFHFDSDLSNRIVIGQRLSSFIKKLPSTHQIDYETTLLDKLKSYDSFKPTAMMTLSDVKELLHVHEIGAHSFSHASMEFETDAYVLNDLRSCIRWFKERLSYSPNVYAFPNGSYRPAHLRFAQKVGFRYVLIVNNQFTKLRYGGVFDRFSLYADNLHEARFRALGGFAKIIKRNEL